MSAALTQMLAIRSRAVSVVAWVLYAVGLNRAVVHAPEPLFWAMVGAGVLLGALDPRPLFPFLTVVGAVAFGASRDVAGGLTVYTADLAMFALFACGVSCEVRAGIDKLSDRWSAVCARVAVPTFVLVMVFGLATVTTTGRMDTAKWAIHAVQTAVVYLFVVRFLPAAPAQHRAVALLGWGAIGAASAVLGLVQYARNGMEYFAVQGTFGQHNPFAAYLMLTAVPCAALVLVDDRRMRRWLAGALVVLAIAGIVVAFSRGAWVGLFVGLGTVAVMVARRRAPLVLLVCVAVPIGSIVGYLAMRGGRDVERVGVVGLSREFGPRVLHYLRAGKLLVSPRPLLGNGPGTYRRVAARAIDAGLIPDDEYIRAHPHNLYVLLLVDTGVLGLTAFLFWILWHLAAGIRTATVHEPLTAALAAGASGAATAFLAHNLFDVVTTAHLDLIFAAVCGTLAVVGRMHEPAA